MADIAIKHPDDALDIVQDAMLTLANKYASKPSDQWAPLFYRILQNRIRDHQRRGSVRSRFFPSWFAARDDDGEVYDPIDHSSGPAGLEPERARELDHAGTDLDSALAALPGRQREAFLLRVWEGLDVAQTAKAMGVSPGSVKTHYSRAVHSLRDTLGAHWHE